MMFYQLLIEKNFYNDHEQFCNELEESLLKLTFSHEESCQKKLQRTLPWVAFKSQSGCVISWFNQHMFGIKCGYSYYSTTISTRNEVLQLLKSTSTQVDELTQLSWGLRVKQPISFCSICMAVIFCCRMLLTLCTYST